jgi:hypothetical protein
VTYAVCPDCEGHGTSSAHLGAFTSDEWDQMDYEWRDDYVAGRFDRACPTCNGKRVVEGCHCGQPLASSSNIWSGVYFLSGCWNHLSEDDQRQLDDDAMSASELRAGC